MRVNNDWVAGAAPASKKWHDPVSLPAKSGTAKRTTQKYGPAKFLLD